MFMDISQKQAQNFKQLQRLIMSPQMQQAIRLMQLPVMELAVAVEAEMAQNPVLEYDKEEPSSETDDDEELSSEKELNFKENDFEILKRLDNDFREHFSESEGYSIKRTEEQEKLKTFLEQSIQAKETLFGHLMNQAKETFNQADDCLMAEAIIGSLDENGYLNSPLSEIALLNGFPLPSLEKVLKAIQTFHPAGVGARNLQECLLLQLKWLNLENTLAYQIIEKHFADLLRNRLPDIAHSLKVPVEEVKKAIDQRMIRLDLHPGAAYSHSLVQYVAPDAFILEEGDRLITIINEKPLPIIRLNTKYLHMLDNIKISADAKDFIKRKLMSAKWFLKNIDRRNETLNRIVQALAAHQKTFFEDPSGQLIPIKMKDLAEELNLHESTITRAVANKYIETPRGLFPLKYFFSYSFLTTEGKDISSKSVREAIKKLIESENKKKPLSDDALSKLLEKKGIPCARRTVAKYRTEMQIGNTQQRKIY